MTELRVLHLATSLGGGAGIAARRIVQAQVDLGMNSYLSTANQSGANLALHESILRKSQITTYSSKAITYFQSRALQNSELLVTPFSINSIPNLSEQIPDFDVIHLHAFYNLLDIQYLTKLSSGDTFKYMCDEVLEGMINEDGLDLSSLRGLRGRLFAQAEPMSNATKLLIRACETGLKFPFTDLVIHNGDVIPNLEEMKLLRSAFNKVYSVNWLGESSIATSLPIGLENRDKRRNGVPIDYLREIEKGLPSVEDRDIALLVAFSLNTNYKIRAAALEHSRNFPGVKIVTHPITPKQYRRLVLRSRYVLSPPGNGPDCHRTWEALYLGAVPIVHRDYWPFLDKKLPVITVGDWDEICEKLTTRELYVSGFWKDVHHWMP